MNRLRPNDARLGPGNPYGNPLPLPRPPLNRRPVRSLPPARRRTPTPRPPQPTIAPDDVPAPNSILGALETMMGSPALSSRRWIWEQYDHMVMTDTVQRPGGDAAVVRVHGTDKGLAISCDVTPRYCAADAYEGAKQAVAECWRNLTAVGADPLAITDCMNFGNPERPEIMGEFASAVEGMAEACSVLSFPVVSGNVSLYNETNGRGILPTPTIGGVGLIPDWAKMASAGFAAEGEPILLFGAPDWWGTHLGQSIYLRDIFGRKDGPPPPVDLAHERKVGDLVRILIRDGLATAVHDLSDGGLAVGLAEMAMASGIGATVNQLDGGDPIPLFFGEDQGRYLVTMPREKLDYFFEEVYPYAGIFAPWIGTTGGTSLTLGEARPIPLAELKAAHEAWFPQFMQGE